MTTNIVATIVITLLTNVVPSDNAKWERDPFRFYPEGGGPSRVVQPATEKYLTTNVTERLTIRYTWNGERREHSTDKLLSSVTQVLKLKQQWESGNVITNILNSTTEFYHLDEIK